jgi:hypothetical protein
LKKIKRGERGIDTYKIEVTPFMNKKYLKKQKNSIFRRIGVASVPVNVIPRGREGA